MSQAWDKEKSESPMGIEPITSQTPGGCSMRRRIHGECTRPFTRYKAVFCFTLYMPAINIKCVGSFLGSIESGREDNTWARHGSPLSPNNTRSMSVFFYLHQIYYCPITIYSATQNNARYCS